jgi:hypothetical protein
VREEDECAEVPVVSFEGIDDGGVRRAEVRTSVPAAVPVRTGASSRWSTTPSGPVGMTSP